MSSGSSSDSGEPTPDPTPTMVTAPDSARIALAEPTFSDTLAAASLAGRGQRTAETDTTDPLRLLALPVLEADRQRATVVTSQSLAPYGQLQRTALIAVVVGPQVCCSGCIWSSGPPSAGRCFRCRR